jgi:hypothetical protein
MFLILKIKVKMLCGKNSSQVGDLYKKESKRSSKQI